jgi:hypothetical protein
MMACVFSAAVACSPLATSFETLGAGLPGFSLAPPTAPAPVEPVTLTPCPSGWTELKGSGDVPTVCEPWPLDGGATCPADQAQFPGDPGCRLVGTACDSGDWATGLPATGVLYVRAGAPDGGDGSLAAPFGSVDDATQLASPGDVVALSKGTFQGGVQVPGGVTLWGACALETRLNGPTTPQSAAVRVVGAHASVKNLTISGPVMGVLVNKDGTSLEMTDVVVDGAVDVAVLIANAGVTLTGHDVVVRNTQLNAAGHSGWGLAALFGGAISLARVTLENNRSDAVHLEGSSATLSDAALRDTVARADGTEGRGGAVLQGTLELTRAVVERNQEVGLAAGDGATLKLSDVLVRGTLSATATHDTGEGAQLSNGATGTFTRCAFSQNRYIGINVASLGVLNASHVAVLDTDVDEQADQGFALVLKGSSGIVDHAFFAGQRTAGVDMNGSEVSLGDVEIRDTGRSPTEQIGNGVQLTNAAALHVSRVAIRSSTYSALVADGAGTSVDGADLTAEGGYGLAIQAGASVTMNRVLVHGSNTSSLFISSPGTRLELTDVSFTQTSSDTTGQFGRGVQIQDHSHVVLTRAAIDGSSDLGIFVGGGSALEATELSVTSTHKSACVAAGTCPDIGGSAVAVLQADSTLTATRFVFSGSEQCGIELAEGGVATLMDGQISDHLIGACILTDGFDLAQISQDVAYVNNSRMLDASALPLPATSLPTTLVGTPKK